MNVLIVFAHPEPRSLNGSLKDFTIKRLQDAGHTVQVSDLYAMQWKAALDADDSTGRDAKERFYPDRDSKHAYASGQQSADIEREQEKLRWADAVILQFPLWWFSMPAILKGWFERVYAYGFGYGVGEHSDVRWGDRYGEGMLAGKRAMLVVTTGGWESHYSPRGINGPIDDLLFPIHHGMLYYPGFDVLPPFVTYRTRGISEAQFDAICEALGQRLDDLWTTPPIAYRPQNTGAYEIPSLTLKPELSPGQTSFAMHVAQAPSDSFDFKGETKHDRVSVEEHVT
ncbi:NAD(P)H-dependent oxidoreductase [Dyella sp. GSA-30]|uniref:NAD(P)H-dependent oxidoreductase n=1 Tax=Dyella sp. GSA-30 TaxID=2994496 RepID=UPI0024907A8D|nr:NAD(P)H-dependent oxidoreductase [Dyella sp. GSA-30]BDU22540.1 dehydrogenase [Dyella sp. GSA-30]